MERNCRNCNHEYYEGTNPCDECNHSTGVPSNWELGGSEIAERLVEALQKIVALQSKAPDDSYDDVMDWSNYGDVYSAGVDVGEWEAARIALEALKAAGVM